MEILNDGILVAHNARFDYSFLKNEFSLIGKQFNPDYCCTVKMFKKLYPYYRRHSLDVLRNIVGLNSGVRHRAEGDAQVIKQFFYSAIDNFGFEKVEESVKYSIKTRAIPKALLNYDFNTLSSGSGVYIFYGKDNYPLYIGMSKNLKRRIRDHLYSDTSYSKDSLINQQLSRIETIPTAGILGASLRESYLVKKLQPLYNRKLRRNSNLIKVKEIVNENGYKTIIVDNKSEFNKVDLSNTILISNTMNSLKEFLTNTVKKKGLCSKFLGLEKGKGACFSYQLGHCRGGCVGRISSDEYNLIFDEVFEDLRIKKWIFNSPITITEEGNNLRETFLFDSWIFLGSSIGKGGSLFMNKFSFNYDTYRILSSYLNNADNEINLEFIKTVDSIEDIAGGFYDLFD